MMAAMIEEQGCMIQWSCQGPCAHNYTDRRGGIRAGAQLAVIEEPRIEPSTLPPGYSLAQWVLPPKGGGLSSAPCTVVHFKNPSEFPANRRCKQSSPDGLFFYCNNSWF